MSSADNDPPKNDDDDLEGSTRIINPATDTLQLDIKKALESDAVLIVIRGTPQGKKFVLSGEKMTLGRDTTADIQINDNSVSRRHSILSKTANGVTIEDGGSRNGTFVNDIKIEGKITLTKEDMIKVGTTILKYIPAGELEILYHSNLTNAAHLDALTEIYNRNYINEVLSAEFKRAKALHIHFSIILFDIDNFKKINDTYGHVCGDYVLKEMCNKIKTLGLRKRDLLGRYGGEEFLLILWNTGIVQAKEMAERIRQAVATHHFTFENQSISVTISLGVGKLDLHHASHIDLLKDADSALYQSKNTGKNKVTVFESA